MARENYLLRNQVQDLTASAELLQAQHIETPGNPDDEGAAGAENEDRPKMYECNICMVDYTADIKWEVLCCSHLFCAACIHGTEDNQGLLQIKDPTCPKCRKPVSETTVRAIL